MSVVLGRPRRAKAPDPPGTTAVILAGGASSRFGSPKGLAPLRGRPLVRWVAESAGAAAGHVVVVLAPGADETPWREAIGATATSDRFRVVHDEDRHHGPVAGVAAALPNVGTAFTFLLGADMPLVRPDLLLGLMERLVGHDAVAFHLEGWWQPLPALWRTASLREATEAARADGIGSLHEVLDRVDARPLGPEFLRLFAATGLELASVNTQADLERFARHIGRGA